MSDKVKKAKRLPEVLREALPVNAIGAKKLARALLENDFGSSTLCAALPVFAGCFVALRYDDLAFSEATLLSDEKPIAVTDHVLALQPVSKFADIYKVHLEKLGLDPTRPFYVLAQVTLPRSNIAQVRDALPKIKSVANLCRYYMSYSTTPNLRLANLLRLQAVDVIGESHDRPTRASIPASQLESHLTSLGFKTFNTHFGVKTAMATTSTLTTEWLRRTLEEYRRLNGQFVVNGLRVISNHANESVFSNLIWRDKA